MLVGHYGASFVAKAAEPRVPIWVLLLAAQLVDVFWAVFVLVGVERVRLDPALASNAMVLESIPYTHSLLGAVLWASAAGLIVTRVPALGGTRRAGVVVALVVVSHWVLDLLVHRPDLTLWGGLPKLGIGLWDVPWLAYGVELVLVASGAVFCVRYSGLSSRGRTGLAIIAGGLLVIQVVEALTPGPATVTELALSAAALYAGVAYAGYWTERWVRRAAYEPDRE